MDNNAGYCLPKKESLKFSFKRTYICGKSILRSSHNININSKKVTMRRDLPTSNKAALCRYLIQINWPLLFTPLVSCEEKWQVFQEVLHSGLKIIMPAKQVKICTANVPWINGGV